MRLLSFFAPRQRSAAVARERLQILLSHEGRRSGTPDFLPQLKAELLEVVARYVAVEDDKVHVRFERTAAASLLEVEVELPPVEARQRVGMGFSPL